MKNARVIKSGTNSNKTGKKPMHRFVTAAVLMSLMSSPAFAGPSIEARLAGGSLELDDDIDNIESETSGIDLRAMAPINNLLFLRGQFSHTEGDEIEVNGTDFDADLEITNVRGGLGIQAATESFRYYGVLEGARIKLNLEGDPESGNGVILSGGLGDIGKSAFIWNVELGLASIDHADGGTFDFTLGYRFNPTWAIVGGGQSYVLDNDGVELSFGQGTLGVRVSF